MRLIGSVSAVALGAVVLMPLGAAANPSPGSVGTSRIASPTVVDLSHPEDLPVGAAPQAAFLDFSTGHGPIYRPGKTSLPVGKESGYLDHLMRVHGGFIVTVNDGSSVRFVADNAHVSTLLRAPAGELVGNAVASRDGRLTAVTTSRDNNRDEHVTVIRIADHKVIVRRAFARPVVVASMTHRRALLTPDSLTSGLQFPDMITRFWDLRTDRVSVFDDAGRLARGFDDVEFPGDLTSGQVAVLSGNHDRVVTIPRRPAKAWRTSAHEWVRSWSPNDRYVLTAARGSNNNGWASFSIRRARDGKLITRLHGRLLTDPQLWSPSWESASAFTFIAGTDCDDSCASGTLVRCTVSGTCTQVAEPAGVGYARERRLPSS